MPTQVNDAFSSDAVATLPSATTPSKVISRAHWREHLQVDLSADLADGVEPDAPPLYAWGGSNLRLLSRGPTPPSQRPYFRALRAVLANYAPVHSDLADEFARDMAAEGLSRAEARQRTEGLPALDPFLPDVPVEEILKIESLRLGLVLAVDLPLVGVTGKLSDFDCSAPRLVRHEPRT